MVNFTQKKQYASRSGEFYKEQRDKNILNYKCPYDNGPYYRGPYSSGPYYKGPYDNEPYE